MDTDYTPAPPNPEVLDLEPHGLLIRLQPFPDGKGWHCEIERERLWKGLISASYAEGRDREAIIRLIRLYMRTAEDIVQIWLDDGGDLEELRRTTTEATAAVSELR